MIVLGITRLRDMPVDVLPEFAPPIVEIQTEALGLSAAEVNELVTVPMEAILLTRVAWVETIRSGSIPGLSPIVRIRARHQHTAGTADGARAPYEIPCFAGRVEAANHAPAPICDQPGHGVYLR